MAQRCSSPDSSISSLLASCSLGSSRASASSAVEYKERLYESASEALEAYIQDYEQSRLSATSSTGRITIHPAAERKGVRTSKVPRYASSRRFRGACDPDLLSLTTDDLLGFPSDGSLPFSRVTEQKHFKRVRALNDPLLSSPLRTSRSTRTHSFHLEDLQDPKNVFREQQRRDHPAYRNNRDHLLGRSALSKSYPRWLTSQKSDLAVSGLTSIPDTKNPLWIKDYGLLEESDQITQNTRQPSKVQEFGNLFTISSMDCLHSRINSLKDKVSSQTLPLDLHPVRHLHTPLKGRADRSPLPESAAADISNKEFPRPPENNQSPKTEDVLEAERSWERIPYSLKSPVPISCEDDTKNPDLVEHLLRHAKNGSFSGGNHHGPVEALKHMLFNLQAFQHHYRPEDRSEQEKDIQKVSLESEMQQADQEIFPVNKSLRKALQHLSRLKELVGDGSMKPGQESAQED